MRFIMEITNSEKNGLNLPQLWWNITALLEYDTFFSKKNLKKFDWRTCSNIGKADKLSECVIRPRVLKINLQPLAVKGVNKKQKPCSLFFKRVRHTLAHPGGCANITERLPIKFFQQICVKKTGIIFQIYFRGKLQFYAKVEVLFTKKLHYFTRFHCNFYDKSKINMFQIRSDMKLWC